MVTFACCTSPRAFARARHEMFRHAHLLVTAQIESVVHRVRLERVPEHVSPTDAASEETLLEATTFCTTGQRRPGSDR